MVFKCCVTGCRSNYDKLSGYVTVYSFPTDAERKDLWIRKIPRDNLPLTKNTRICINHFEDRFIIKHFEFTVDGISRMEPRDRPLLTADAFPTIFPSLPSYLTTPLPPKRKSPEQRRAEVDDRDSAVLTNFLSADVIDSYDVFVSHLALKTDIDKQWIKHSSLTSTVLFLMDEVSYIPRILVSVKIDVDLIVRIFVGDSQLPKEQLSWILNSRSELKRWSQLQNILGHYANTDNHVRDDKVNCSVVRRQIEQFCDSMEETCRSSDFESDDDYNTYYIVYIVLC